MTTIKKLLTTLLLTLSIFTIFGFSLPASAQYGGGSSLGDGSGAFPAGPTSGSTGVINRTTGQTLTLTNPIAGIDSIDFTFNSDVSGGNISFELVPVSSILGTVPSGSPVLVLQFSYSGVTKSQVSMVIRFKIKDTYSNISAYYFNSPASPIAITGNGSVSGNNLFTTASFGAPSQFAVAAVGASTTVRSGAFDVVKGNSGLFITITAIALLIITAFALNSRKLAPKVQR